MKIEGISAVLPERIVTNDEIINIVKEKSEKNFKGNINNTLDSIQHLLNYCGASQRHWCKPDENYFTYFEKAVNNALEQAHMTKNDIDLLIYACIDKRVLEPSMASFSAHALGLNNVQCFDVSEACNSWTRATYIADSFLKTGYAKSVMILAGEFCMHEDGWLYKGYEIEKESDIDWAFANCTLGEAATATILTYDEDKPWNYLWSSGNQYSDLCVIPLDEYNDAMSNLNGVSVNGKGPRLFASQSKPLCHAASKIASQLLAKLYDTYGSNVQIVIPHCHAKKFWDDMAEELNKDIPFYNIFSETGNIASASIPTALSMAIEEGKIKRDDPVHVIMAAAGISCAAYTFNY